MCELRKVFKLVITEFSWYYRIYTCHSLSETLTEIQLLSFYPTRRIIGLISKLCVSHRTTFCFENCIRNFFLEVFTKGSDSLYAPAAVSSDETTKVFFAF